MKFLKDISVIIRCKNEERWIGHSIQSIIDNIGLCEIIVVDNNSTDKSLSIVKSFAQDPKLNFSKNNNFTKIKILNLNDYSPGKSINLGVKKANGKYVVIMSAHCVLKKINLKKTIKDLEKFVAIFGNQIPIWKGKKIKKRYIWSHFCEDQVINMYSEMEERYFFHNAIAVYKSKTLIKNPFDEYLTAKEDRYWINNQVNKKQKFLYDPSIEVDHHYTENGNTWKGLG